MDSQDDSSQPVAPASQPEQTAPDLTARSAVVGRLVLWLGLSALVTVGIAWVSVHLQSGGFAPVILLPAMIGMALGAAIEGLARALGVGWRRDLMVTVAVCALGVIAAQDYIDYWLHYRAGFMEQERKQPMLELAHRADERLGPANFGTWFLKSRWEDSRGLWIADGVATLVAAISWTIFQHHIRGRN